MKVVQTQLWRLRCDLDALDPFATEDLPCWQYYTTVPLLMIQEVANAG